MMNETRVGHRHDAASGFIADVTRRHMLLLRLIPKAPQRIDTGRLLERLAAHDIHLHRRSLLRDLTRLEARFAGLTCDRRSKPHTWSWRDHDHPWWDGLDLSLAMVLYVARKLTVIFPKEVEQSLSYAFREADEVLSRTPSDQARRWRKSVDAAVLVEGDTHATLSLSAFEQEIRVETGEDR